MHIHPRVPQAQTAKKRDLALALISVFMLERLFLLSLSRGSIELKMAMKFTKPTVLNTGWSVFLMFDSSEKLVILASGARVRRRSLPADT